MSKEKLEKEAEESAKKFFGKPTDLVDLDNLRIFKNGYLASAEPREKQIQIDAEHIIVLQKQNGELTDELTKKSDTNHQLIEQLAKLNERCSELESQIEKMKNCNNCANYMISGKCPCLFRTGWCKNWKMAKGDKRKNDRII